MMRILFQEPGHRHRHEAFRGVGVALIRPSVWLMARTGAWPSGCQFGAGKAPNVPELADNLAASGMYRVGDDL